jgi:hypothetical protein
MNYKKGFRPGFWNLTSGVLTGLIGFFEGSLSFGATNTIRGILYAVVLFVLFYSLVSLIIASKYSK